MTENTTDTTENGKKGSTGAGKAIIGTVKRMKAIEAKKENAGLEDRVSQINLLLASKIGPL